MSNNIVIDIENVSFGYQKELVLKDINLKVSQGEAISLIGPSGLGKTTLLRLIAGDYKPDSGTIKKIGLWRRVFQSNALLPWLTVKENILLGLRGVNPEKALHFEKVAKILDLNRVLDYYPRQLSGGLAQRTELARALIGKPDGLLLDEPFSSLDYFIRHETRNYLAQLLNEFPITMILVTHDIPEAVSLTKRSLVINGHPATILKEYENTGNASELVQEIWQNMKISENKL